MGRANSKLVAFLVAFMIASGALATSAWADCAPYVSSGAGDEPMTGTLTGTETVTETIAWSLEYDGAGISGSRSVSYQVGYYKMSNGQTVKLDCRTYTVVD